MPGSVTLAVTIGVRRLALLLLEVEAGGRAGLDAADAEVAAVHEAEGVVEDELVLDGVAARLVAGADRQRRRPPPRRR